MTDFWSFLLQTLTVSTAAVLVLIVKGMFRDKLPPRWQFASWGIVGLALLLPAGVWGHYALVNWPFLVEAAKSCITGEYGTVTKVLAPVPLPSFGDGTMSVFDWLYAVYVAGVAVCLARYLVSYLRLRLALRKVGMAFGRHKGSAHYSRQGKAEISVSGQGGNHMGGSREWEDGFTAFSQEEEAEKEEHTLTAQEWVDAVAARYFLPSCRALEVKGLFSAFVCGVFRPVLVLSAEKEVDEKVILHELLHVRHHDILWGLLICLFRCLHWCNPLLWVCADVAGNDLEALCDQRVMERLSGEQRRDYGRILLSMADGKYAGTPGTSSIANGGRNIRWRIQAIARFKKYPAGMGFVSACILLVLSVPFVAGAKSEAVSGKGNLFFDHTVAEMVKARIVNCTTHAGAFDTYAKALLFGSIPYRAMCAPLSEQDVLAAAYRDGKEFGRYGEYKLPMPVDVMQGYQVYNLVEAGEDAYEGLLVLQLFGKPGNVEMEELRYESDEPVWFAVQDVRVEEQDGRFVALPQEAFRVVQGNERWGGIWLNGDAFPAWHYEDGTKDFSVRMWWNMAYSVGGNRNWADDSMKIPQPDGAFEVLTNYGLSAVYIGEPENKSRYRHIAYSGQLVWEEEVQASGFAGSVHSGKELGESANPLFSGSRSDRPSGNRVREGSTGPSFGSSVWGDTAGNGLGDGGGSSTDGSSWCYKPLEEGWEDEIFLGGGGSGSGRFDIPDGCMVKLYLNGKFEAELWLELMEGGTW